MCAYLCYRVCWSRCRRRVLQEEEGDVPLVTQLHKVAALQRRLVQQLSVAGHYSYQVAEVDTSDGGDATSRRNDFGPSQLKEKQLDGHSVLVLPMYLCKASDERRPVATFELLEATPICQAADYLGRAGGRFMTNIHDYFDYYYLLSYWLWTNQDFYF